MLGGAVLFSLEPLLSPISLQNRKQSRQCELSFCEQFLRYRKPSLAIVEFSKSLDFLRNQNAWSDESSYALNLSHRMISESGL
jgi:hypothetical protein